MTLKDLREKRNGVKAEIDTIIKKADTEQDGILTAEQDAGIAALESKYAQIDATIKTRERAEARDAVHLAPTGRRSEQPEGRIEVVGERMDPSGGFKSLAHFARDVRSAILGSRPTEAFTNWRDQIGATLSTYHNERAGVDGGFLVPPQFSQQIYDTVWDESSLLARFPVEPTESNNVTLLKDETTPWGASGIKAYWRGEADAMTATKSVLKEENVRLGELYAFTNATDELLADAPRLTNRLTEKSALAIRYKLLQSIIEGDGVAKPLGYLSGPCLVSQAKESGQTAATINAANLGKMLGRMANPDAVGSQVWVIHPDAINQLIQLTIGNQPVWTSPMQGVQSAPNGLLLGRPVFTSDFCATLGTVNDIHLVDTAGYYLTQKGGIKADTSTHLYFDQGATAFRWTFRAGGQPILSSTISPKNGSSTRSHFVVLATRS